MAIGSGVRCRQALSRETLGMRPSGIPFLIVAKQISRPGDRPEYGIGVR